MNTKLIQKYIHQYKEQFDEISKDELYKWKAIKQFQDNWNIEALDFAEMLQNSFSKSNNLLASGNYFPLKMLLQNSRETPEKIRTLFRELFEESKDLEERIQCFRSSFDSISNKSFAEKHKKYQDDRAILVYLSLKYPEEHFLYKFNLFRDASKKMGHVYVPIAGRIKNISQFYRFCEIIKYYVEIDQELLLLHKNRLTGSCYIDLSLHVLTQDIIYAIAYSLKFEEIEQKISIGKVTKSVSKSDNHINKKNDNTTFVPHIVDYERQTKRNKHIGNMGESWVVHYEKEKLITANKPNLAKQVVHIAKEKGDGAGYDITSFDVEGNEILIEVKTTTAGENTSFYITQRELERSKKDMHKYYLYRLFDFDEEKYAANLQIKKGSLEELNISPTVYKAKI